MVRMIEVVLDIVLHMIKGCLLIYLLRSLTPVKSRFIKCRYFAEAAVVLQYTLFYMALSYIQPFRIIFYGSMNSPATSRLSIIPLAVSMGLTMCVCLYFYGGKRNKLIYLIFTYYAVNELIMFTLHTLFVAILEAAVGVWYPLIESGNAWVLQNFNTILAVIQFIWNLAFQITFVTLLYIMVKALKKALLYEDRELTGVQQLFLVIPSVMGMCYSIMLRSILYKTNNMQIEFLIQDYPETNVLIPAISGLCLILVLVSAVTLRKLIESNEKEVLVEIYQNRISDMEEHMKDVEHLYDGIRGMRHDMKNYVSDLEILLKNRDTASGSYEEELRGYFDGLYSSMEKLEMKCSTGNPVTDVVISRKMRMAEEKEIPFACEFIYPQNMGFGAFDISIILNNGLDNAIEAVEKEEDPYIRLCSYVRENMFFLEIRNTFTGELKTDGSGRRLLSSKENALGHGLGMKNIVSCAEKYYGKMDFKAENGEFILTVMLQGKNVEKE